MANEPVTTIVGNLTADPELRYIQSGTPVCNFNVAQTPRNKNRDGEWEDGETMFVRCAVWREYAENVADSLSKGMRVVVTGRLKVQTYQTDSGERRTSLVMDVDEVGPSLRWAKATVTKANSGNAGGYGAGGGYSQPQQPQQAYQQQAPQQADGWESAPPF